MLGDRKGPCQKAHLLLLRVGLRHDNLFLCSSMSVMRNVNLVNTLINPLQTSVYTINDVLMYWVCKKHWDSLDVTLLTTSNYTYSRFIKKNKKDLFLIGCS